MTRSIGLTALALGLAFATVPARAVVYCKTVGVPKGCVVRPVWDRSVNVAQDALRDSKSPQRPRDETAFWPAFAPHPLRWLRHYSAFATPLREWLDGVRDALCRSPSRLRACAPSALRVYARAHTYAGLPASRFALPWPAA